MSQHAFPPSISAPEMVSRVSLLKVCQSALVTCDIRERPLAIYQAPGGASNTIHLKCLQGLARGNLDYQTPKGMSGLWGLKFTLNLGSCGISLI